MQKTCRDLPAFSWGQFSWTEMICVKKLTFCNSVGGVVTQVAQRGVAHSLGSLYLACLLVGTKGYIDIRQRTKRPISRKAWSLYF